MKPSESFLPTLLAILKANHKCQHHEAVCYVASDSTRILAASLSRSFERLAWSACKLTAEVNAHQRRRCRPDSGIQRTFDGTSESKGCPPDAGRNYILILFRVMQKLHQHSNAHEWLSLKQERTEGEALLER